MKACKYSRTSPHFSQPHNFSHRHHRLNRLVCRIAVLVGCAYMVWLHGRGFVQVLW